MLIISKKMGGYPDLNWELTVPHTAALPIELYPPFFVSIAKRSQSARNKNNNRIKKNKNY